MAAIGHQRQPQQQQQQLSQQTTQLEFHQAMRDFKTMFPEMDEDVIEVVLRANQGAVDATIDQLLAMSTDNENERLRTEMDATENAEAPPGYSPTTPPPTYQQAVPYSQLSSLQSSTTGHTEATALTATSVVVDRKSSGEESRKHHDFTVDVNSRPQALPVEDVTRLESACVPSMPKSSIPLRVAKNWSPPLLGPLPCDFLRLCTPDGRVMKPCTVRIVW